MDKANWISDIFVIKEVQYIRHVDCRPEFLLTIQRDQEEIKILAVMGEKVPLVFRMGSPVKIQYHIKRHTIYTLEYVND